MDSNSHWSDFISTPPNLSSSPFSDHPLLEYYDSSLQPPPSNYPIISEEKSSKIFMNTDIAPQHPLFQHQYQNSQFGFNDFNEIENRTLLISNVNPNTTRDEIEEAFFVLDGVKKYDFSKIENGIILIEYYDLRFAIQFKKMKNGTILHGSAVIVSYAPLQKILDPKNPPNNGTIVVFNLSNGINDQLIESTFGHFGLIRQIRGTPAKPNQRFIEYYDTRNSELALNKLNGKYVLGSRVSIEFSLPGGFRRNVQRPDSTYNRKHL